MTDNQPNSIDLSDFDTLLSSQETGISVVIKHPITGDDTSMTFVVAGPDSPRAQAATRASIDSRLKRGRRQMTAEQVEREARRVLARRIIAWGGFVLNGAPLELSVENVVTVFLKYPFVYEQVDAEANDRESFTNS